ncbi:N-alpha-acetyltransferase 30-like [Dendronephthya gigantea]|uniref:N-alpha-acetyltransferase 30-like n=1 Tax=Dendronephthya gigantea TaxID=151771 RepID=UPI0010690F42|nr:N-alpha-acetyltransferase 30-like [Dendronephthya gigantea]
MEGATEGDANLTNSEDKLQDITDGISNDLVLGAENNHSDPKKVVPVVNLPETTLIPVNSMPCRDGNCGHSHQSQLLPLGYTPPPISVRRVKFDEHGDTHEIEVEGHGKVTINYLNYESEAQMKDIMALITKDLSEPYSIYTYRYFIHNWPKLSFLAYCGETCIGAIVCKLDLHKKMARRGYIAMLAVDNLYRRHQIGSNLVIKAIRMMIAQGCDEVVLETEITNVGALRLYENLGFVRDKRLFKYYLNGVDALRLKLWLR